MDLQFKEGSGLITRDWAKPHHTDPTLIGAPAWADVSGLPVLDFDSTNPDYINILAADSVDLNFTTGAFSGCVWINLDDLGGSPTILGRGTFNTGGWWAYTNGGYIYIRTAQNLATQTTVSASALSINTWFFIAFTRNGSSIRIYVNGVDVTETPATHINPAAIVKNFYVASYDGASFFFDGTMWRPRIWGRALEPEEIKFIFESERWRFSV